MKIESMRGNIEGSLSSQQGQVSGQGRQPELKQFDWNNRWLKGHEYAFILKHAEGYCHKFGFQKFSNKTHPQGIYERPVNGTLYFVEGTGLGSEFGFPRVEARKKFRWKKMNFSTNLPKKNPRVTYIVASTTHSHQINDAEQPLFRMHAVVPYDQQTRKACGVILCHILEIKRRTEIDEITTCCPNGHFDFYKLFAFLHNLSISHR